MVEFDKVKVGDEIPVSINQGISQEKINKWAEVSVDFNPLHVNPEFGRASRFQSTISHGTLTITCLMAMLTQWIGKSWLNGGQLQGVRFVAPVLPGDTIRPRGKVADKRIEGDKKVIEWDVWVENQRGDKVITGKAIGEGE